MTGFDPLEVFATPADNPLVPRPPIRLRDTEIFTIVDESGPEAVAAVVPWPLEQRPNAQAPVYRLPVRRVSAGFHRRCDLTLPYGRVVHDYLDEEAV